jgi:hypothetical protein
MSRENYHLRFGKKKTKKNKISNAPIMIIQKADLQKQWKGIMNTSWHINNQRKTVNKINFSRESLIDIGSYKIHRKLGNSTTIIFYKHKHR